VQWPVIINIEVYKIIKILTDKGFDDVRGEKAIKIIENLRIIRKKTKVFPVKRFKALLKRTGMVESFDKKKD